MTDDQQHKFCVNCVHYVQTGGGGQFSPPVSLECHHPRAPRDPVHGSYSTCASERNSAMGCGPSGSRWQRKPAEAPQPPPNGWWPPRRRRILWFWPW